MWEAGKEAGFIGLLKHENKTTLASLYFRIKCHNYEAEKVRDVSILAESSKNDRAGFVVKKGKIVREMSPENKQSVLDFD
jgi:hypothetical protein